MGIVGVGNFAKSILIPEIMASKKFSIIGVSSNKGLSSKMIFDKYNAEFAYSNPQSIFKNKRIDAVVISTRHDSHSKYVIEALKNDKHVFVEKPLAISRKQLTDVKNAIEKTKGTLSIGFNRRYSSSIID